MTEFSVDECIRNVQRKRQLYLIYKERHIYLYFLLCKQYLGEIHQVYP